MLLSGVETKIPYLRLGLALKISVLRAHRTPLSSHSFSVSPDPLIYPCSPMRWSLFPFSSSPLPLICMHLPSVYTSLLCASAVACVHPSVFLSFIVIVVSSCSCWAFLLSLVGFVTESNIPLDIGAKIEMHELLSIVIQYRYIHHTNCPKFPCYRFYRYICGPRTSLRSPSHSILSHVDSGVRCYAFSAFSRTYEPAPSSGACQCELFCFA